MSDTAVSDSCAQDRSKLMIDAFIRARADWADRKHLLDVDDLSPQALEALIQSARAAKHYLLSSEPPVNMLCGKTIATVFYENSTRTRSSFDLAARRLGATVVNLDVSTSSVAKGETIIDTATTLLSMGARALIQRHAASGSAHRVAHAVQERMYVINAGDGWNAHPTQALLDYFSMTELGCDFQAAKIAIVGDIKHSRVARSNIRLLTKLGASVHVSGPPTLLPSELTGLGVVVHTSVEAAIEDADFVMVLRLQLERQKQGLIPSIGEYCRLYRVDSSRMRLAKPGAKVLHPGPVNRNVEISDELAERADKSIISDQVANGLAVRMAVLYLLLGDK